MDPETTNEMPGSTSINVENRSTSVEMMLQKVGSAGLVFLSLWFLLSTHGSMGFSGQGTLNLTQLETEIASRVNATNIYDDALALERIALNQTVSGYTYRSAGTQGASETAAWIERKFHSFGLASSAESFEFKNWSIASQPVLRVDVDGNLITDDDQVQIKSFRSAHFSYPLNDSGFSRQLVTLPLLKGVTRQELSLVKLPTQDLKGYYNSSAWNSMDTTGKIVLIGREALWYGPLHRLFRQKVESQRPAAVIFTWWYAWMSYTPPIFNSYEDRAFWDLKIPTGWVDYEDGQWLKDRIESANVSAWMNIASSIGFSAHSNVVAMLRGAAGSDRTIIISSHYDTVLTSGLCEGGAGVAGMLELARVFSEAAKSGLYKPKDNLVFIAFTGEELGLVGSIEYVKKHKDQLRNVKAVVHLGGIGNKQLRITETFADDEGLNLQETVFRVAQDLGIDCELDGTEATSQETFRNPAMAEAVYKRNWGVAANINDTVDSRVKSSVMLFSGPLSSSENYNAENAVWYRTEYDNSTTGNWVQPQWLDSHVKVAVLSVVRILSASSANALFHAVTIAVTVLLAAALLLILKPSGLRRIGLHFLSYVEEREAIYAIILTVVLLFSSYAGYTRVSKVETLESGFSVPVTMRYFGYPYEMLAMETQGVAVREDFSTNPIDLLEKPKIGTVLLWNGLLLNTLLFFFTSLAVVYLATRVKDLWESRSLTRE